MATWLKQSTAVEIAFGPFVDQTDGFTAETGLTIAQADVRLKKNGGDWAQKAETTTAVHEENGWYRVLLDTTDTNTLGILVVAVNEAGALPVWREFMVVAAMVYDSLIGGGDTLDVTVTSIGNDVITAASVANGAIDAATFAAGAIDASAIATNAIDADALATDAVTEIRSVVSGTSDSGSTTTMVDAARTEADVDYWKGMIILFTSGTISGQARLITAFDPVTDTITFSPVTTQVVGTQTYEILPSARVDLALWLGSAPNALVSSRVDVSVGAMASGTVTATAIATDAIDGDALAATALSEIKTQVTDALAVDTYAELGAVPAATSTLKDKINWLFLLARNKITLTQSTGVQVVRNDADSVTVASATHSDDGSVYTRTEWS